MRRNELSGRSLRDERTERGVTTESSLEKEGFGLAEEAELSGQLGRGEH